MEEENKNILKIWIITLFPEYFDPFMKLGVVGQFLQGKRGFYPEVHLVQLRDFANTKYKSVDDSPYGGGPGMVMRADVLRDSILQGIGKMGGYGEEVENIKERLHIISPSPRGKRWDSQMAKNFAKNRLCHEKSGMNGGNRKDIVFVCGRYEGMDERFIDNYVDEEICVGDYILSGGELAVMTILDSAFRFLPGVLGNEMSPFQDSFEDKLLEAPQFTRPPIFEKKAVPEILLSGHHERIENFRHNERLRLTRFHRPDLFSEDVKKEGMN